MNGFMSQRPTDLAFALATTALDCPHFVSAVLRLAGLLLRDYDAIAPHLGLLREAKPAHILH